MKSFQPMQAALLFVLMIVMINAQKPLTLGVPVRDVAPKEQFEQFKIDTVPTVSGTTNELIFIVTPFSGDADIYVKASGPPTLTDFDLKAADTGADYIWINATSPLATHPGPFYVGIYAHESDVSYSVICYVSNRTFKNFFIHFLEHIQLNEGVPQLANVRKSEYIYLKYTLAPGLTGALSFSNIALLGDPGTC
jgi:hypothetical protein